MGLMFPKPASRVLVKRAKKAAIASNDRRESAKVKSRSGGVCEDCDRARAVHVHHLLGGIGVRGRGKSALAENKLHLCTACHARAHGRAK